MTPSLVSQCLTRTFEKSKVFCHVENKYKNVSPSRLRFSIITELICLNNEQLYSVAHCFGKVSTETCKKFYVQFFSNMEAARLSWKCINLFSTSGNNEKAANLREKLIEKARIPNSTKIREWYNQLLNSLKHKGLPEEDISDTGLEEVIRQFDNEENLTSTYDDETVDNAPLINTSNDGDKTESEVDGNEDSIASNYDTSIYGEYDDSYLRSFRKKCSAKKKKSFGATIEKDWHISTKLSRAQIMALLYSCHELIEDKSHQPHSNQCMSRIKELSLNNPNWAEKCYLNDLHFRDIQSTMKAMWRKRQKIEEDPKKQA